MRDKARSFAIQIIHLYKHLVNDKKELAISNSYDAQVQV